HQQANGVKDADERKAASPSTSPGTHQDHGQGNGGGSAGAPRPGGAGPGPGGHGHTPSPHPQTRQLLLENRWGSGGRCPSRPSENPSQRSGQAAPHCENKGRRAETERPTPSHPESTP